MNHTKEFNKLFKDCESKNEEEVRDYLTRYDRETLLEFSAMNDSNGVYTDAQNIAEYGENAEFASLALATAYLVETITGIELID